MGVVIFWKKGKQLKNMKTISYMNMRRTIGWIGILLPFIMFIGAKLQPAISYYYYTNMREVFEGALFMVALFLFSYKGYDFLDNITSNLAGFFCLGVAMFPVNIIKGYSNEVYVTPIILLGDYNNILHFICAGLFFIMLAIISIFLFTKSVNPITSQKKKRNRIYKLCGYIIFACVITMAIYFKFVPQSTSPFTFWCESISLIAFGTSWLIKGEVILQDKL
jgi:hypothetical protein